MNDLERRAVMWYASGDTGLSSKTIWNVMLSGPDTFPLPPGPGHHPLDSGDFGRCYRLLAYIPEWRPRLKEVAFKYPGPWTGLVINWNRLSGMYFAHTVRHGWEGARRTWCPEISKEIQRIEKDYA